MEDVALPNDGVHQITVTWSKHYKSWGQGRKWMEITISVIKNVCQIRDTAKWKLHLLRLSWLKLNEGHTALLRYASRVRIPARGPFLSLTLLPNNFKLSFHHKVKNGKMWKWNKKCRLRHFLIFIQKLFLSKANCNWGIHQAIHLKEANIHRKCS